MVMTWKRDSLWGESTNHQWIPPPPPQHTQRASNAFDAFFVVSLNKLFKNNQVSSHDAHVTLL